ncbi:MAG: hypothetical protein SAqBPW_40740 [Shewanella algae]
MQGRAARKPAKWISVMDDNQDREVQAKEMARRESSIHDGYTGDFSGNKEIAAPGKAI